MTNGRQGREEGTVLLMVSVFLATAIAGLATISSGRVVHASRSQRVLESETRAFNSAYAQIHMAMNVVNNSAYDEENHNLALQDAVAGVYGGTVNEGKTEVEIAKASSSGVFYYKGGKAVRLEKAGGETTGYITTKATSAVTKEIIADEASDWLDQKDDPKYGLIQSTNVRVYRARDYISRLQRLKGEKVTVVDPGGLSDSYYVIEAAGRIGDTIRLVSALVRENEPFSSFVMFQDRGTLGISGSPRGLTHANEKVAFYFPNGSYLDSVSAVDGFEYIAGATVANTGLRNANPDAARIDLSEVDFNELKGKADLFVGQDGLDAWIKLYSNGNARIREYTPPRYEMVTRSRTRRKKVGSHYETYTKTKKVKVGTKTVSYEDNVFDYYKYEDYWVWEKVKSGEKTEIYYVTKKVKKGTKKVKKTKPEPIWGTRTVTKYKKVKVWVSYNSGAGGGTSVAGGGGSGNLGEYVYENQPYQATEQYISGYKTVTYYVDQTVYENKKVKKTRKVNVYKVKKVKKTKRTKIYKTVTKTKKVNVYEYKEVTKKKKVNDYEYVTKTWEEKAFQWPVYQGQKYVKVNADKGGTVYIDGRVIGLYGDLNGRLTIVANEKVRIVGNLRYVDKDRNTAMKNGSDYRKPYERNPNYKGNSVLGIIARDDIVFTRRMPSSAELNGTMMSVNGRVGVDGFWADEDGELVTDSSENREDNLTEEQQETERAYDKWSYTRTRRFTKDSLRRIGGIISSNRIMETYITTKKDGTSRVSAGFKRGSMKFDINLLFNPPPNFVEVPRPVLTYFVPIMMVRDHDS